jgi:N-acetyl-alpha-D-glucosaminyl L-malate synthase BshA
MTAPVLGIVCHSSRGGSVRAATDLATAMAGRGYRVHVLSPFPPLGHWHPPPGVTLHTLHDRRIFSGDVDRLHAEWSDQEAAVFTDLLVSTCGAVGIDVLHVHYAVPFAWLAVDAAARLGARAPALVATLHGTDASHYAADPAWRWRLAAALARMDAITTVSQNHAALIRRLLPLLQPAAVIPNFVDLTRFVQPPPTLRAGGRVLHLSNFRPAKNSMAVAEIFACLRTERPAELWLGGCGPELPAVEARLAAMGLAEDVRSLGWRDDAADLMAAADVLVLTSREESFSLTALEAMACGLPVVAPRVGGLPELVKDGVSGLLYEPGDIAAAATLAGRLLEDGAERRRIGAAGIQRAARYAPANVIGAYERLYARLGARNAPRVAVAS